MACSSTLTTTLICHDSCKKQEVKGLLHIMFQGRATFAGGLTFAGLVHVITEFVHSSGPGKIKLLNPIFGTSVRTESGISAPNGIFSFALPLHRNMQ